MTPLSPRSKKMPIAPECSSLQRPGVRLSTFCLTQNGLTLVELMIAMALGLVVVLGAVGIMGANRQNFRMNESLSELQENARSAFELIARDARQARDTGCGPVSVSPELGTDWWESWQPVEGFDGTTESPAVAFGSAAGQRVEGTDALQLQSTENGWPLHDIDPDTPTSSLNTLAGHPFQADQIIIACDLRTKQQAGMYRVSSVTGNSIALDTPAQPPFYQASAQLARMTAVTWYIGNNGRVQDGGRSLYRIRYDQSADATVTEEVLPGVTGLQLRFREPTDSNDNTSDFTVPASIVSWDKANTVELTLTTTSTQTKIATPGVTSSFVGSDGRLQRSFTHIIALRNS